MAIRSPRPKRQERQATSRYHGLRMSEKEYLALPEEKPYLEYADGVVLQKPMPNIEHTLLTGHLIVELGLYARRVRGHVGPEARVRFTEGANYRLPDVSFWSSPGRPADDAVPTLAIEVRSPGQTVGELRQKCRFFRRNGVHVAWLVDPETRTVEVFESDRDAETLAAPAVLSSPALPGFELDLAALFAVLEP